MSLTDWQKNGWLKPHQTSREEIQNILQIIKRDLQSSCNMATCGTYWVKVSSGHYLKTKRGMHSPVLKQISDTRGSANNGLNFPEPA